MFLLALAIACTPAPPPDSGDTQDTQDTQDTDDTEEPVDTGDTGEAWDSIDQWFLIAGQSNACGGSTEETSTADGILYRARSKEWAEPIEDPSCSKYSTTTSPWPSFARNYPGRDGLINTAKGGTCLVPDEEAEAHDGRAADWDPDIGTLYAQAIAGWERAGSPEIVVVLWHQGECEASRYWAHERDLETTREAYKAALINLAEHFYADVGAPLMAVPLTVHAPFGQEILPIHQAIIEASRESPLVYMGPYHTHLDLTDYGAHIYEVNELGRLWADAVLATSFED